jgi:anion-transporting  ArsA/GET3 family ATPase
MTPPVGPRTIERATTVDVLERLARRQMVVVTGKGGVGKTTVAAVLARSLAARGRKVLLLDVDPRESLHHLLDVPPSGGEVVTVAPRLQLQHLEPRRLLDDLVREKLKVGILVRRVLASPVHQHFTEGAPGLKETAVFGRSLRLIEGHVPRGMARPEVVILDAPAAGHAVAWLAAPRLISEVVRSGPIGHMATTIAAFMTDRERFGVVVVTTAEEMPVQESLELIERLDERLQRRPDLVVVNSLYPPLPAAAAPDDPAAALWAHRRDLNDRELARLLERWSGPTAELPLVALEPGPLLVAALARQLELASGSP